jgi:hypothetical protein
MRVPGPLGVVGAVVVATVGMILSALFAILVIVGMFVAVLVTLI